MSAKKTPSQPSPKTPQTPQALPSTLSQQLAQLDALIAEFDRDDLDLDDALDKFEQGMRLTQAIRARLEKAENEITVLRQRFGAPDES